MQGEKLPGSLNHETEQPSQERIRRTCELLEQRGDAFSYEAHAAHFLQRTIQNLDNPNDPIAWDKLHLELGGHAAASGDEVLLRHCFSELKSLAAKWRLFEISTHYTDVYLPLGDLVSLGEERAIAETHDYGTLVGVEQVILEMDQNSMGVEELKAKETELSVLRQQAQDSGQPISYFAPWYEPQPSNDPDRENSLGKLAAHLHEGKMSQARQCYEALIGGDNFYHAAYSSPEKNLRAALLMARHDKAPDALVAMEPSDGYFHQQIIETDRQHADPKAHYKTICELAINGITETEKMPWSLVRVQRVIEIVELLQEYTPEGRYVPYDIEEKLHDVWKMVCATTDLESKQRTQAYRDISPLLNRRPIGIDPVEATRALFLGRRQ